MSSAYTIVLTSCGRFDLLERTLRSLLPRLDADLAEFVITEDSGDPAIFDLLQQFPGDFRVLLSPKRRGQLSCVDLAYQSVRTNWVFHCEDDWEFFGSDFIAPSRELLTRFPNLSLISLRPREELNRLIRDSATQRVDGINFFCAEPTLHPEYFGYSFNPGLRRLSDYKRFAPLTQFSGERDLSYCFKRLGYTMGYLETPAVRHIGNDRHVDDPTTSARAYHRLHRFAQSVHRRYQRLCRRLIPSYDPATRFLSKPNR